MNVICLAVGKRHDADIAAAIDDYTKRLSRYTPLTWQIVPPAKGKTSPDETKRVEGAVLRAAIQDDDYVVLLDERGTQLSSPQLADILERAEARAKRLVFVIGGAYGVSDNVARRADLAWSLSKLVFPHQLVRLILAEQLYRANTIRRDEPYHHE